MHTKKMNTQIKYAKLPSNYGCETCVHDLGSDCALHLFAWPRAGRHCAKWETPEKEERSG